MDSGCGSVGRAVASDSKGPRFESSHWRFWRKDEKNKKRGREWLNLKKIRSDGHGQMLYKKFFAETVWPIVSLKPQESFISTLES